jgi:hypothetical protein
MSGSSMVNPRVIRPLFSFNFEEKATQFQSTIFSQRWQVEYASTRKSTMKLIQNSKCRRNKLLKIKLKKRNMTPTQKLCLISP